MNEFFRLWYKRVIALFVRDIWHKCDPRCFKIAPNSTRLTAREITWKKSEISLVIFMPNITTNHTITYTNFGFHVNKSVLIGTKQINSYIRRGTLIFWNNPEVCALEYIYLNGDELLWTNDLESLENFVENVLKQQGKRLTPGGVLSNLKVPTVRWSLIGIKGTTNPEFLGSQC